MKNNIFINRYVMACAISIVLALVGFISMSSLPIEQYPNIAPPQVEVTAYYMGADPKTIIQSVISPLEESINGVRAEPCVEGSVATAFCRCQYGY